MGATQGIDINKIRMKMREQGNIERPANRYEAVRALLGEIRHLLSSGYSFEEINQIMRKGGMQMTDSTFRTYYYRAEKEADA